MNSVRSCARTAVWTGEWGYGGNLVTISVSYPERVHLLTQCVLPESSLGPVGLAEFSKNQEQIELSVTGTVRE